jgi:hypothetical protein
VVDKLKVVKATERSKTCPAGAENQNTDSENSKSKPSETGREFLRGDEVIHCWLRRDFRCALLASHE